MVHGFRGFAAGQRTCPSRVPNLPRPDFMSHMRHRTGPRRKRRDHSARRRGWTLPRRLIPVDPNSPQCGAEPSNRACVEEPCRAWSAQRNSLRLWVIPGIPPAVCWRRITMRWQDSARLGTGRTPPCGCRLQPELAARRLQGLRQTAGRFSPQDPKSFSSRGFLHFN